MWLIYKIAEKLHNNTFEVNFVSILANPKQTQQEWMWS
jgi:hypothetical protein